MHRKDQKKVPIGIIPGGTGNTLAYDFRLVDPIQAANAIVNGKYRQV